MTIAVTAPNQPSCQKTSLWLLRYRAPLCNAHIAYGCWEICNIRIINTHNMRVLHILHIKNFRIFHICILKPRHQLWQKADKPNSITSVIVSNQCHRTHYHRLSPRVLSGIAMHHYHDPSQLMYRITGDNCRSLCYTSESRYSLTLL